MNNRIPSALPAPRAAALLGLFVLGLAALTQTACHKQGGLALLAPGIAASPQSVDFGPGNAGSTLQMFVDLTSTGTAPVTVSSVTVAEDPNGELSVTSVLLTDCHNLARVGGLVLQPTECARFAVRWAPRAVHAAAGKISIVSDDPDHGILLLPVTGNGTSPALRLCALRADGSEDSAACSRLAEVPPFLPSLDWGVVGANAASTRTLRIYNDGTGPLVLDPPALTAATPQEFKLAGSITANTVPAGQHADLPLSVTPHANGSLKGGLRLSPGTGLSLEVPLLAVVQGWRLCVDPPTGLDFGQVPVGQQRALQLTMKNCGSVDFNLKSLAFLPYAPTTGEFTVGAGQLPATPAAFPAGAEVKLDVVYKPTVIRTDNASLDVLLDVPAQNGSPPQALADTWPVVGQGAAPVCNGTRPVAAIQVFRGGSATASDPNTAQFDPLEHVSLDGSTSTQPNGALTYVWRLVSQPTNGTEQITGGGGRVGLWLKQSGDYVVELVVKDAACQSTPVQVTLHSVPKGAIHVELSWPQYYGDLDLHFVGPGGQFFAGYDTSCGFAGLACGDAFFAQQTPDWGCADSLCNQRGGTWPDRSTANDPSLDIDQRWGNGPENTTHMNPFDGTYKIVIHYWCARKCSTSSCSAPFGNGTAIVRVWINGVKSFEKQQALQEFQAWDVANVTVTSSGRNVTVADANGSPRMDSHGCIRH